ncbi:MAG: type III polyketide synthase [Acidobacteria bacterium]|nr:type III polyketide synthase [Acidobacteriota bacterium]
MPFFVQGIGTASPPCAVSQEHAAGMAQQFGCTTDEQLRQLKALYRMTRVKTRHSVVLESGSAAGWPQQSFFPPMRDASDRGPTTAERMARYERDAPALGAQAALAALADAGRQPSDITHVVSVSCTGFAAPNFDLGLVRALDLPWTVARTHVGFMGCHGALNGLRVARAYADSMPESCVLVCAVELCSLHYQYGWQGDWLVSNAIFADGAAAIVGSGTPPSGSPAWELRSNGSSLLEDSAELMSWRIGNHGFEMSLSARVPGVIERELRPWLDRWLGGQDLSVDRIATWAVHPGGPRILESVAQATGIGRDDYAISQEVLSEFGNMSSPTILFILERLRKRGAPLPCLALGFGPGLAVEAALFR